MGMLLEYLSDAIRSIRNNRFRTALTMLGIIIGIASVIAVLTIGDGMTAYVKDEMGGFSGSMFAVNINITKTAERFGPDDLAALKEDFPELKGVTISEDGYGVITGPRAAVDASITSGTEALEYEAANKMIRGRYFTDEDVEAHAQVIVLMERDAKKLFGTVEVVGKTLTANVGGRSKELTIIGVREDYSEAILSMLDMMEGYLAMAEMPYTTYADAFATSVNQFDFLTAFAGTGDMAGTARRVTQYLRKRHNIREDKAMYYTSMADISDQIDSIMGAVSTFMTFVAAISLLVGGIGVMNIMLVSVTERTREIGIRKSIGARTGAILVQFLAEASIISLLGGIAGVVIGLTAAAIACHLLEFQMVIKPSIILLATATSTLIGLFFGLHPARKAAKMKPIDALRF